MEHMDDYDEAEDEEEECAIPSSPRAKASSSFPSLFFNQKRKKLLREKMKNLHTQIQARIKEF